MVDTLDAERLRRFREQTLYRLLIRAARTETNEMAGRIRRRGYPDLMGSYPVLLANLDTEGTSITNLAAKAGVTRQAASQLIREIEARGYLERRPDPSDGRAVIVSRTPRGGQLLRDALEVVSELEAEYAEVLGRRRFDAMRKSLSILLDHIDPGGMLNAG
jgi:DNA-binding MarR family transcriptional regulator